MVRWILFYFNRERLVAPHMFQVCPQIVSPLSHNCHITWLQFR